MAKVGYDMYLNLLEKAIEREKSGNDSIESIDSEVKIDIKVSAYISDSYISDTLQKIAMYQKISNIKTKEDTMDVVDELFDRYGKIPTETENLIKIVEIRNMAKKLGINRIFQYENIIKLSPNNTKINLTNNINNDILITVQKELEKLLKEKG